MKIDPNTPAFPTTEWGRTQLREIAQYQVGGLSIRAHFAGLAMQGLLANASTDDDSYEDFADGSVRLADALIAELNKETP